MNANAPDSSMWDTSAAKREITSKIRQLQGRGPAPSELERQLVEQYISRRQRGPAPFECSDVLGLFERRAKDMLSTVVRVVNASEAGAAIERYLNDLAHAKVIAQDCVISAWPMVESLNLGGWGKCVVVGTPQGHEAVGISGVAYAVAETGTLVFASKEDEPARTHLLPETHIAVVNASQVVHCMEDAFDALRAERGAMPRAFNFVSGPSRTADIEQTIVLGAHGPYRVHIVIIDAS